VDDGRLREEPPDHRSRLGRRDAGQHVHRPRHQGDVKNVHTVRTGIEYMMELAELVHEDRQETAPAKARSASSRSAAASAGDFPICVVPMLHQDFSATGVPLWGYFCQISRFDHVATVQLLGRDPQRKDHVGQTRRLDTPKFIVESDATIVAPLIFAYVLKQ
jgi:deoxyhypusine synthase